MADIPVTELSINKEMGYSRVEFINQFKLFAKDLNYTLSVNSIKILSSDINMLNRSNEQLIITFSEQSDRRIGALNIPRLCVNFHFTNYTEQRHKDFLKTFDLSFQRGGG